MQLNTTHQLLHAVLIRRTVASPGHCFSGAGRKWKGTVVTMRWVVRGCWVDGGPAGRPVGEQGLDLTLTGPLWCGRSEGAYKQTCHTPTTSVWWAVNRPTGTYTCAEISVFML